MPHRRFRLGAVFACVASSLLVVSGVQAATTTINASADTWLKSGSNTSGYSSTQLRSGTLSDGTYRSLVRFPQSTVDDLRTRHILSTRLRLRNTESPTCTAQTTEARRLATAFSDSTYWGQVPAAGLSVEGSTNETYGGPSCADGWLSIPITAATVDGWAKSTIPNHGLMVRAPQETTSAAGKRFTSVEHDAVIEDPQRFDPKLEVTYNSYPAVPGSLSPADRAEVGATPTLGGVFSDPDGGSGYVDFEVRDVGGAVVASGRGSQAGSKSSSSWNIPDGKLRQGESYTWRARAFDGRDYSGWTGPLTFSASGVLWEATAEPGNFSEWLGNPNVQAMEPSRATTPSANPSPLVGQRSFGLEVRTGDQGPNVCGDYCDRAQANGHYLHQDGDEDYTAVAIFVPQDYPTSLYTGSNHFQVTWQWHGAPFVGSPPLELGINKAASHLDVSHNYFPDGNPDADGTPGTDPQKFEKIKSIPLEKGKWLKFVWHVKWSPQDSEAFTELWYAPAGQPLLKQTFDGAGGDGTTRERGSTLLSTMTQGIAPHADNYRRTGSPNAATKVYFDAIRAASSFDAAAGAFGEPLTP